MFNVWIRTSKTAINMNDVVGLYVDEKDARFEVKVAIRNGQFATVKIFDTDEKAQEFIDAVIKVCGVDRMLDARNQDENEVKWGIEPVIDWPSPREP